MRRLQFHAHAEVLVEAPTSRSWAWADRLPQALGEFPSVQEVRAGSRPDSHVLVLKPVGFGPESLSLSLEMRVEREAGRLLRMRSLPGGGNADAVVSVGVEQADTAGQSLLSITMDVSPHKPAGAIWPRELIEKASSASLRMAARHMLKDMKQAIEAGGAVQPAPEGNRPPKAQARAGQ